MVCSPMVTSGATPRPPTDARFVSGADALPPSERFAGDTGSSRDAVMIAKVCKGRADTLPEP